MRPLLQRTDLRMLDPVLGPASQHWGVVTAGDNPVPVGALVKMSYEPYEVRSLDANGDVLRRATFQKIAHALAWLERYCRVPSDVS